VLTIGKVSIVRGAAPATFRAAGWGFGFDEEAVFFERHRLPKCDPASWRHLGSGYSRDDERVYYCHRLIAGADAATFEVLPSGTLGMWARDARRLYVAGAVADPAKYWDGFRALTIFVGTVVAADVVDEAQQKMERAATAGNLRCRFTIRNEALLHAGAAAAALVPTPGGELSFSYFNPLVPLEPARWVGRSRLWFCAVLPEIGDQPATLYPAQFRSFWPASRQPDAAALIASCVARG
jgi:hypothetical protein